MTHNLRLNQVTIGAPDMGASIAFYQNLGLILIVDSAPRYARFEFPEPENGEPATLSLHGVTEEWQPNVAWPLIYFEVNDVASFIADKSLKPVCPPEMKSYFWEEADVFDPAGNQIRIFSAGENRRFPPWRITP